MSFYFFFSQENQVARKKEFGGLSYYLGTSGHLQNKCLGTVHAQMICAMILEYSGVL